MGATIIPLRRSSAAPHRLVAALPDAELPFKIEVNGRLAAAIREAAGWAGRSPEQQARACLEYNFVSAARDG